MNFALVAFVAGAILVTRAPALPSLWALLPFGAALLASMLVLRRYGFALVVAGFTGGLVYTTTYALIALSERLPAELAGTDLRVEGTVISLPQRAGRVTRFRLRLDDCERCWADTTIALSAYDGRLTPQPGEVWSLTVRLDRPRGSVNPGLFDYDGWLLAEGIGARGYVRASPEPRRLKEAGAASAIQQLRQQIRERIDAMIPNEDMRGLLIALTIGESSAIGSENWRKLSATGTNHLLIISGLHVGLVAGAGFKLWRLLGASQSMAGVMALTGALAYGGIAGMGLPVQRSLVMTAVALSGVLLDRYVTASAMFCIALAGVTLLNPFAVMSSGFWLSFGAVFFLLFVFGATPRTDRNVSGWLNDAVTSQWVAFAGTLPLLAWTVGQVSLVAMLTNLVAIPWVSVLVIPILLIAVVCLPFSVMAADIALIAAARSMDVIWRVVDWFAGLNHVAFFPDVDVKALLLAILGSLVMLSPRGLLPRWPGMILWLPLLTANEIPLDDGMEISVIDVGQGLSVLVRTPNHTLLYDAGPRFGDRFDAGERIVTPMLRSLGVTRRIDTFVVSHTDIDHAGGEQAVRRNFLIDKTISETSRHCRARWEWEKGDTRIAAFPVASSGSDNDRSCVVLVSVGASSVLLPGDIETAGEKALSQMALPDIDVLIAPHHGSQSSSTPMFLNHVSPSIAIASAGYRNRFGHPDEHIVVRYQRRGIAFYNTAETGAITVRLREHEPPTVSLARRDHRRFWYD